MFLEGKNANIYGPGGTAGPLVVSEANPRYFAVAAGDRSHLLPAT